MPFVLNIVPQLFQRWMDKIYIIIIIIIIITTTIIIIIIIIIFLCSLDK